MPLKRAPAPKAKRAGDRKAKRLQSARRAQKLRTVTPGPLKKNCLGCGKPLRREENDWVVFHGGNFVHWGGSYGERCWANWVLKEMIGE